MLDLCEIEGSLRVLVLQGSVVEIDCETKATEVVSCVVAVGVSLGLGFGYFAVLP